jgi:hypothetical protein
MSIILLLAAQAAGQVITTFHPLPSQKKEEQAQQAQQPDGAKPQAEQAPPKPAEPMKVLSVREVSPDTNVVFVPPDKPDR